MQAQEYSFGELLLKMRGTYLKDSVETVSPESPLLIHNWDGLQTGLADSSDHFSRNESPEALNTSIRNYREEKELRKKLAQL